MSCQKENGSTYRIDRDKLPIDKRVNRRFSTDGEVTIRVNTAALPNRLYSNQIQFVSTDSDDNDELRSIRECLWRHGVASFLLFLLV